MFGYIDIAPDKLEEERRKRYKACYCGLCRALKDRAGAVGRLTLSNDMTFLSLLLGSLYEPGETSGCAACLIHPVRRRAYARSAATEYAADMNLLLAYYKCLDNARDENSPAQARMAKRLEGPVEEIRARYPRQAEGVWKALEAIRAAEEADRQDADSLSGLCGQMLGSVFVWKEGSFAPFLYGAGHALGQFIYLMDAWEDYDADLKKGRFNPLKALHAQADYEEVVQDALTVMMGRANEALEMLPLEKDVDLIRNVIYDGVWNRYSAILSRRKGGPGDSGENAGGEDCAAGQDKEEA